MIKAKIICDSVNTDGKRLTTFELEYPRIVHAEFMTHRQISRNAASSRAIPFEKMLQQLDGVPSRFGAAQKGMQDNGESHTKQVCIPTEYFVNGEFFVDNDYVSAEEAWQEAKQSAVEYAKAFKESGYHKQIYNRLTEPFQMIKVIASATEWDNFFWLRDDVMADPTLAELARKMREAYDNSTPQLLKAGEWHLPYVDVTYLFNDETQQSTQHFIVQDSEGFGYYVSTEQAIKVSAARCAAVSYRNEDYTLEKCLQLYERLVGDERKHASALEHQATPIVRGTYENTHKPKNTTRFTDTWEEGISHTDRDGNLWSGNFKGFIQHRKTIKGECK